MNILKIALVAFAEMIAMNSVQASSTPQITNLVPEGIYGNYAGLCGLKLEMEPWWDFIYLISVDNPITQAECPQKGQIVRAAQCSGDHCGGLQILADGNFIYPSSNGLPVKYFHQTGTGNPKEYRDAQDKPEDYFKVANGDSYMAPGWCTQEIEVSENNIVLTNLNSPTQNCPHAGSSTVFDCTNQVRNQFCWLEGTQLFLWILPNGNLIYKDGSKYVYFTRSMPVPAKR